ncbi:glycosyltransferase family 9 protein [Paeniglutamicibacter antarcticus]|uniref:Glycosyltransferase family 9 protein n=1 Tax=Arthrobacter terrae TaxID=2935737 RepID=A0A931CMB3_9MICC|nr:glycosyltransferase family 9 protein [Arthrobacter terrae]MBG0741217.1 glycosyltransferase family 9 protein [Arthrobacter terrae]
MDSLPSDGRPEVLALRALKLGDLLVAVPALHALRRAYPGHRLIYAAQPWLAPVLALVGGVDTLLKTQGLDDPLSLSPGRVEVAVNLHGSGPESLYRLDELAPKRRIGHLGPGWDGPQWRDGVHERERWAQLLQWHGIPADPLDYRLQLPMVANPLPSAAVVHVGAAYGSRLWPQERFAAVARGLEAAGHCVTFTGSEGERRRALQVAALAGLPQERVVAGTLGLDEFAAVIAGASIVVSADTGAAHLASAYGRRSVVIFGPAPVSEWGPPPGPHIALTRAELRRGDTFSAIPDPALLAVSAADVLAAARDLGCL